MGPKLDVSRETITRIHTLYKAGFSASQIVSETGFAKHTVERWLQRCCDAPDRSPPFPQKQPRSSRRVTERLWNLLSDRYNMNLHYEHKKWRKIILISLVQWLLIQCLATFMTALVCLLAVLPWNLCLLLATKRTGLSLQRNTFSGL